MEHIWKPIVAYEGYYTVSNYGEIQSLNRIITIKNKQRKLKGKLIRQRLNRDGYPIVELSKGSISKTYLVHRITAFAFLEPVPGKGDVNHINGKKWDNRVINLEWVTKTENMQHAFRTGLWKPNKGPKKIRDKCTGTVYDSIAEAARLNKIPTRSLRRYLNHRDSNKTCLEYAA